MIAGAVYVVLLNPLGLGEGAKIGAICASATIVPRYNASAAIVPSLNADVQMTPRYVAEATIKSC